ncbi:DUF6221 family protein [Streptomyces sp. TX20-6-3]|uniref:DUF6221 family protein n=1 Tax=Streptomyces sp. TX20-6-3 TaxID=3028705 RepID=UPI0029B8944D|nr:DUF6221 family protein [Streptomyces sp. TX20-6-3]MDX2565245.1 DUF6221 family protein [Streptomyces sp. TX20-6-3]
MELAKFVAARLDEDEQVAKRAGMKRRDDETWTYSADAGSEVRAASLGVTGRIVPVFGDHIARHDPARVLAEVDAKRRILASYTSALAQKDLLRSQMRQVIDTDHDEFARLHKQETELFEMGRKLRPVVAALALPYAGHPDYDEAWRP